MAGAGAVTAAGPERSRGRLEPGDLLTVPQARAILPVSRASLYRLAAQGAIDAVRVRMPGGRVRLLLVRKSLESYAAAGPRAPDPVDVDGMLARIRNEQETAR